MTWLKFINVFVLQWFFIRLTLCKEIKIVNYKVLSYDIMFNGSISSRGQGTTVEYSWYSIQGFILPLSGWWNEFYFLSKKPFNRRITDKIDRPIIETLKY